MLSFKSSYKNVEGTVLGTVLDFPGTITYGETLDEARQNLASALQDMAETKLLSGEALPTPDPSLSDPQADLEEPIHLLLQAGNQLTMNVGVVAS